MVVDPADPSAPGGGGDGAGDGACDGGREGGGGDGEDADGPVEPRGDPRFDALATNARLRRTVAVGVVVVLLGFAAAIGLLADLERPPLPPEAFPAWRTAVGALLAAVGALALVLGVVMALRGDLLGAWSRSPMRTLSPPARQQLLRRVHGEEWTPPGGMAQARAAAEPGAQRLALVTLYGALLLLVVAQAFLATRAVAVLLAGLGGLLLFWGLPLLARSTTRARRFLDDHPEP